MGCRDPQFPYEVIRCPSLGHPRREDMEARPVWRRPIPACPRLDSGSVEPGRAGLGACWVWKPHPGNVMTSPGSLGSSQSETWKTNFSSWKGRDGITLLFLSLPTTFALSFPALRDERWQKLDLVIRGLFSAEINKLNNADEVNEV